MEDLAEELVGEISDEHDDVDEAGAKVDGEDAWVMDGDLPLDEAERIIGHELPRGDFETLAGLLIAHGGDLPALGERLVVELPHEAADMVGGDLQARWIQVGEMAPKSWAIAHPELAARVIGVPSRAFVWPFRPFLLWVNLIANKLVARTGLEPVDKAAVGGRDADTIRGLVDYSERAGVLEPELGNQLSSVLELEGLTVADITEPDAMPTAVAHDAVVADIRAAARETGHLRILMRDEAGTLAQVVHVRDTMPADVTDRAAPLARPVFRVDEATPVYELLRQLREQRQQLAVVDRGPDVLGIVTVTDVVARLLPGQPLTDTVA